MIFTLDDYSGFTRHVSMYTFFHIILIVRRFNLVNANVLYVDPATGLLTLPSHGAPELPEINKSDRAYRRNMTRASALSAKALSLLVPGKYFHFSVSSNVF